MSKCWCHRGAGVWLFYICALRSGPSEFVQHGPNVLFWKGAQQQKLIVITRSVKVPNVLSHVWVWWLETPEKPGSVIPIKSPCSYAGSFNLSRQNVLLPYVVCAGIAAVTALVVGISFLVTKCCETGFSNWWNSKIAILTVRQSVMLSFLFVLHLLFSCWLWSFHFTLGQGQEESDWSLDTMII